MAKEVKKNQVKITKGEKEKIKKEIKSEVIDDIEQQIEEKVVDDVVNTIKEESKDQIKADFVNEVKLEVKEQIIKEEKRLLRHRKWKIFRRDLFIILLFAVIAFMGYLIYKGFTVDIKINTEQNSVSKDIDAKESEVVKDKDWYITNLGYLLDYTTLKISSENMNKYYLYNRNYDADSLNNSIKLTMAYNLLGKDDIKRDNNKYIISRDNIKKAYSKLFNTAYNDASFTIDCMTYQLKDDHYEASMNTCTNINNYDIKEEITDMYEEDGNIIIETVMGVKLDNKLYNYTNLFNEINDNVTGSIVSYKDQLNSYKYTFKKDGKYYKFIRIERV